MADTSAPAPIIIIKKKSGHGGHHGGAWKVAYADFVTALMALFIVLWLVNTSKPVREAVAGYFRDPSASGKETGSSTSGNGKTMELSKTTTMEDIKKKLEEAMKKMPELQKLKNQIEMTITNDGLRIEMLETEKGVFFESGSPHPSEFGVELLDLLAKEIGTLPNHLLIEGHTDSRPYVSSSGYSNWELSTDRANSARNIMQANGIRSDQVSEVRGYAAQKLRKSSDPEDASNRRISVTVKYLEPPPPVEKKAAAPGGKPNPMPPTPQPAPKKH